MIAQALEAEGLPTVLVMMFKEVALAMRPPRVVHVQFPFGRPLGEPRNVQQQRVIIEDALDFLATAREPGALLELPYRWRREEYDRILAERRAGLAQAHAVAPDG